MCGRYICRERECVGYKKGTKDGSEKGAWKRGLMLIEGWNGNDEVTKEGRR